MNFIKKVFDKNIDERVHLQFQKFSRGEFGDKALIKAKKSKEKYTITTTAEFANEMVRAVAEKLGDRTTPIKGAIVSTSDLTGQLDFEDKKQAMGVKKYIIDREMTGNEIIKLFDRFPKAFFALTFEAGENKLKIKPKAPKSAKSKNKGKKTKPDFCKLVTTDSELGKSFVFEKPDFKEAEITHTFFINELILPEGEKDFSKIREMAKRKGKIIREAVIDGQEVVNEKEFVA